jgi:hypothetical protein
MYALHNGTLYEQSKLKETKKGGAWVSHPPLHNKQKRPYDAPPTPCRTQM